MHVHIVVRLLQAWHGLCSAHKSIIKWGFPRVEGTFLGGSILVKNHWL